jgi:hypothetical protein
MINKLFFPSGPVNKNLKVGTPAFGRLSASKLCPVVQ